MLHERLVRGAVVAAFLVVMAGCSDGPSSGGATPQPSVAAPSTPATVVGQDALAAYEGMWNAFSAAAETANWQSSELARFASGPALDQLIQSLQADQVQGVVTTGTFTTSPIVVSVQPETAPAVVRLRDCGDDSGTRRLRGSDGQVLPGGTRGRHRIDAEVRVEGSVWKVVDFSLRAAGTC